MEMPDYSDYDGLGLAELVAKRAVTPSELVEAAIARIERHNPTLNAVVYKGYDDARARALGDLPEGAFKGVPFLIKDLGMPVAGWPRSHGSKFARGVVDAEDGDVGDGADGDLSEFGVAYLGGWVGGGLADNLVERDAEREDFVHHVRHVHHYAGCGADMEIGGD